MWSGPRCWRSQQEWSGAQMHGWETRILLRHHLERGVSKTELSRRFRRIAGRSTGGSRRVVCWTHYPSWGSGTPGSNRRPQSRPRSSLPLMGIGNACRSRPWLRNYQLITPHGDREHRRRDSCRAATTRTHYPSWGSGTRASSGSVRTGFSSTHYPSWGSGNLINYTTSNTSPPALITPHGDREHIPVDAFRILAFNSLPLMGIGNGITTRSAGRISW